MTPEERFRIAVETVLRHEGGFSDDPADRGGATNYGLSSAAHPDLDVRSLTREQAIEVYRDRYWLRYRLNEIENPVIATKILDLAVWMGPGAAARYLQIATCACGELITVDGIIGSQTLAAVNRCDGANLLVGLRALAREHVRRILEGDPTQRKFARGWERRSLA